MIADGGGTATFDQSIVSAEFNTSSGSSFTNTAVADAFVNAAVAIAQYATDQGAQDQFTEPDPEGHLAASPIPSFLSPSKTAEINSGGTYSYANYLLTVDSGGVTIDGNNDVVVTNGGVVTVSGFNDAIDVAYAYDIGSGGGGFGTSGSINASNATILIGDGNVANVAGNNDQITQIGPSQLNLTSGTGDVIYVTAATGTQCPYANSYAITMPRVPRSQLPGAGTSSLPNRSTATMTPVSEGAGAYVTVSGTGDTVDITARAPR